MTQVTLLHVPKESLLPIFQPSFCVRFSKCRRISTSKGKSEFWNCKEVPSRRKLVLTSLQGAWHNHGQRTHCMVRSSTMGSWAETERYIGSLGVQLEIRHSEKRRSQSVKGEGTCCNSSFCECDDVWEPLWELTFSSKYCLIPERQPGGSTCICTEEGQAGVEGLLQKTKKKKKKTHVAIMVKETMQLRISAEPKKKKRIMGHTHCGKKGCARTASNPTLPCFPPDAARRKEENSDKFCHYFNDRNVGIWKISREKKADSQQAWRTAAQSKQLSSTLLVGPQLINGNRVWGNLSVILLGTVEYQRDHFVKSK